MSILDIIKAFFLKFQKVDWVQLDTAHEQDQQSGISFLNKR